MNHRILIWTRDDLLGDVLAFALRRLGYTALFLQPESHWALQRDLHFAGCQLVIAGPSINHSELRQLYDFFSSAPWFALVVLSEQRTEQRILPSGAVLHTLPFDLNDFNHTLQRLMQIPPLAHAS